MDELVKEHLLFLEKTWFATKTELGGCMAYYNDYITDIFWNHAICFDVTPSGLKVLLQEISDFYKKMKRVPAVYVTQWDRPKNIRNLLAENGYRLAYKDSWMVYTHGVQNALVRQDEITVSTVTSKEDLAAFFEIFYDVFNEPETVEEYTQLSEGYKTVITKALENQPVGIGVKHYLARIGSKPVGCASLVHDAKFGSLYNFAVLKVHRGKGIGRALFRQMVKDTKVLGLQTLFLQTASGSEAEKMYTRWGFEKRFSGELYTLGKA